MGADFVVALDVDSSRRRDPRSNGTVGFSADQQAAYHGATYGWKHFFEELGKGACTME